jgi:signal transduction histidine kinase
LPRFSFSLSTALLLTAGAGAAADDVPLRTVAEVRHLPAAAMAVHPKVRVRGVMTFSWHSAPTEFTLQDASGAVWLPQMNLPAECRVGTEIEVTGTVEQGGVGPVVKPESVRALGQGTMPAPRSAVYEDLLTADFNALRVELTGVIRGQRVNPETGLGWLALELASGGGRVTVNVTHEITGHPELVDARVRVRGVCLHGMDSLQQTFLPVLNAHGLEDIDVVSAGTLQPFTLPVLPLNALMRSTGPAGPGHRVHVRGTVTLQRAEGSFFLQDETRGLQVFLREPSSPLPDEVVEVTGFPEPGAFSPVLRDADWRPSGSRARAAPLTVGADEAVKSDGRLLTVSGHLNAIEKNGGETLLTLENGGIRFVARAPGDLTGLWIPGSILSLTGVCAVEVGNWESLVTHRQPQGFSLLLRGPADVALEKAAPWWTPTRTAWMLAATGLALLAGLGSVWLRSRRRLVEVNKTREAARVQFQAVLGERTRLARDIHDTLAQGFAGISMQLEVLNDRLRDRIPDETMHHLECARDLVRHSLAESRRTVWNLRAQSLEECGLTGALERLGQSVTAGHTLKFDLLVTGEVRPLPPGVEDNLLRIGQEALTNSIHHSRAAEVHLCLAFRPDSVTLTVRDDGCGFDAEAPPRSTQAGGFGLRGIRERAAAMGAVLRIKSCCGAGTTIEIAVRHV